MNEIIIFKSGNFLFGYLYNKEKNKYINLKSTQVMDLLDLFKNYKRKIKNIFYDEEGNINFSLDDMEVKITDVKKLVNDEKFSFLFNLIKDKKYKIVRAGLKIASVIGLAAVIAATGVISARAINNTDFNNEQTSIVSYEDDSAVEPIANQEYVIENKNDTLENKDTQEAEEKEKNDLSTKSDKLDDKENNLVFYNIDQELNVGTLSSSEKLKYVEDNYSDIIEKYSSMYNLDSNLITAIATQERGSHSDKVDDGGAIGLMQIQVLVWNDKNISVYNYETNSEEKIHITLDKLKDVDFNIKVGCAIFQNYLKQMNGNVIAAIQSYNMGPGSVKKIISTYAKATGKTYDEVLSNVEDIGWLDYRNSSYPGDPDYVEHVSRYYNSDDSEKLNVK